MRKQQGFTLIEIITVLFIIGILATLVGVKTTGINQEAREMRIDTDLSLLLAACERYGLGDNSIAITAQEDLVSAGILSDKVESPVDGYTYAIYAAQDGAWVRLEKEGKTYEMEGYRAEKISTRLHPH